MKWKIPEFMLTFDLELKEDGRVVEKVDRWQGAYTVVVVPRIVSKGRAAWSVKNLGGKYFGVGLSPDTLNFFTGGHAIKVPMSRVYFNKGLVVTFKTTCIALFFITTPKKSFAFGTLLFAATKYCEGKSEACRHGRMKRR